MKLNTREATITLLEGNKKKSPQTKKIVGFTSGTFDLLHAGHVSYLTKAKEQCDCLIVGVNTDASVKKYKDPSRPYVREDARAAVVAALEVVDYVFLFDEKNNNDNVTLLRPDIYFKAGDYSKASLSSAPIVESYGGKIVIVETLDGYSTTSLIHRIQDEVLNVGGQSIEYSKQPAVFVDRDGTLIELVEYLHEPKKVVAIPGAFEGLKKLSDAGYRIIIVTNQPGIGLGYYEKEALYAVNRKVLELAFMHGVLIDRIYFCPHSKADKCECRKPGAYLVTQAQAALNLDLAKSYVIGDMTSDVALAEKFGGHAVLVETGFGRV